MDISALARVVAMESGLRSGLVQEKQKVTAVAPAKALLSTNDYDPPPAYDSASSTNPLNFPLSIEKGPIL